MEYEEHEKQAWSVDFSRSEPSMLVSGSIWLKHTLSWVGEDYWFKIKFVIQN